MPVLTVPTFPGLHVGKTVCGTGMYKEQLETLDEHDFNIKHNELLNEYTNRTWLEQNKAAQAIVQSVLAELKEDLAADYAHELGNADAAEQRALRDLQTVLENAGALW